MKKCTFFTMLVVGLATGRADAQKPYSEDVFKNALTTSDGYRRRTQDERYEGLYTLKVGAPLLEVVSVTRGPVSYELAAKEQLTLLAPPLRDYKQIGVSGTSFGLNKNYRLDAIIEAGGRKVIPVREVLSPNYIYRQNLGVFGYIGEPQYPTLYVPVRASARPLAEAPISVLLLPGTALEKLTWSYAKLVQGQCAGFREKGQAGLSLPAAGDTWLAHQPIALNLSAAAPDLVPGDEACLSVRFRVLGDPEWHSKSIKLLITP